MDSQNQNNQSTDRLNTIRLSLPDNVVGDIRRMRLVGNDLILYVPSETTETVTKCFTNNGFNCVERVYKLHVSAESNEAFQNIFAGYTSEQRKGVHGRVIYTVTVDTQEKYNELIALSTAECSIKQFKSRFAKHSEDDVDSDTEKQLNRKVDDQEWTPVQRKTKSNQRTQQGVHSQRTQQVDRSQRTQQGVRNQRTQQTNRRQQYNQQSSQQSS
jgi:hypothetical protein